MKLNEEWLTVVTACEAVAARLPDLVPGIVEVICNEVPDYAVFRRADLEQEVASQLADLLHGLAERTVPPTAVQDAARALGRRRAAAGVSSRAMVNAIHTACRQLWDAVIEEASRNHALTSNIELVALMWTWVQESSAAAADAHEDTVRPEQAAELGSTHRLLTALLTEGSDSGDLARIARAAGFDPAGEFQAFCVPGKAWTNERIFQLQRAFPVRATVRCASRGESMVLLTQQVSAGAVVEAVQLGSTRTEEVGIGLPRSGLGGAAISVQDAQDALALAADTGQTVRFQDAWMLASLRRQSGRLNPLIDVGRDAGRDHPDVAQTVRCFADSGYSMTATSRKLNLHPNTVKYRLNRWEQLTGWNVYTWEGLCASVVALTLPCADGVR